MKAPAGRCRFCGHTPDDPQLLSNGDERSFVTRLANRCNAPACIRAWEHEQDVELAAERERSRQYAALRRTLAWSRRAPRKRKKAA